MGFLAGEATQGELQGELFRVTPVYVQLLEEHLPNFPMLGNEVVCYSKARVGP